MTGAMSYHKSTLAGKRILVTGAGRGIGRCCALSCAKLGAEVIAVSRTEAELTSLVSEADGVVRPWVEDVTSARLVERIAALDSLEGLVNNAGTNRVGPMQDRTGGDIDTVIDLNIRALYRVSQAAITPMRKAGRASIVNMSSQMGHVGSPGRTLYCMSKHAVEGLTKAMAVELAEQGIRVNSVAPTFVLTSLTEPMLEDKAFSDFVMGMIPMKKLASQQEVADACIFLLSDLSASTTGTSLLVDGGWTAR
jgi:NAD(P)-dependent dehydrogenase (short-subunit alcohol dehydrogenase family)